jgi:hypothetical protein
LGAFLLLHHFADTRKEPLCPRPVVAIGASLQSVYQAGDGWSRMNKEQLERALER